MLDAMPAGIDIEISLTRNISYAAHIAAEGLLRSCPTAIDVLRSMQPNRGNLKEFGLPRKTAAEVISKCDD